MHSSEKSNEKFDTHQSSSPLANPINPISDGSDGSDGSNGKNNGKKKQPPKIESLPDFPLNVLPMIYKNAVIEIAGSICAPVEIVAMTLISLVGAAIGRTLGLKIKKGWTEYPNLYVGIIGPSGIGKSPAGRAIYKHVEHKESKWFKKFQEELDQNPEFPHKLKQLTIDDATTESLTWALDANPRGILWSCDELAYLFKNLYNYTPTRPLLNQKNRKTKQR